MIHTEAVPAQRKFTDGLTPYHYVVLLVACLGWAFDTMDQWLYVQAKTPAISELLKLGPTDPLTKEWVGTAQMWMMIGWATGGLFFGMVGDRLGRTRTMGLTILIYAGCTGLCGLARTPLEFTILRFMTGLGIGGEFAAGASLVAETFPAHSRATALGIVQALSAVGNIGAGMIWYVMGATAGWRWVFAVGALPALLLFVIFLFIREPEAWVESRQRIREGKEKRSKVPVLDLFREPILRHHTFVGVGLAAVGVIGFWGISTWSAELIRGVLNPQNLPELAKEVEQKMSICMMAQNAGGFFGVLAFSWLAQFSGRRISFVVGLAGSAIVVPATFYLTKSFATALIFFPMMGFILLMLFGGYAIYFPEMFPTRLRATGTGFCYNVARYVSAFAPYLFGRLSANYGIQMAALLVSAVFVLGLFIMPFAPETKDKPLPE
ncbi:MAG: MFS transporter [Candidatus Hydrogenedentes bacterium]|nr:MFS transporter [Candidatus Hydrogenedentota bacterium]